MAEASCLVCGHGDFDPHLDVLLKCPACGFVTARIDTPINLRSLYEGGYFTGEEYLDYRADEALFSRTFRKRLKELRRRRSNGRLLEIGSAYGFFLDLAKSHFDVVGFEPNAEAARYARETFGVEVRTDDFLQATREDVGGTVDVTVMWDVIEHLQRPDLFLAHVAELSKPGALLYVTTGDIGSRLARIRGRKWRLIHPPSHLHYFGRNTITRLLANHGFCVLEIRSVGVARSLRQILYSLLVLGFNLPRVHAALKKLAPPGRGFTLNTFDIMQVVAQRA